jgi:hypothetical protein
MRERFSTSQVKLALVDRQCWSRISLQLHKLTLELAAFQWSISLRIRKTKGIRSSKQVPHSSRAPSIRACGERNQIRVFRCATQTCHCVLRTALTLRVSRAKHIDRRSWEMVIADGSVGRFGMFYIYWQFIGSRKCTRGRHQKRPPDQMLPRVFAPQCLCSCVSLSRRFHWHFYSSR